MSFLEGTFRKLNKVDDEANKGRQHDVDEANKHDVDKVASMTSTKPRKDACKKRVLTQLLLELGLAGKTTTNTTTTTKVVDDSYDDKRIAAVTVATLPLTAGHRTYAAAAL